MPFAQLVVTDIDGTMTDVANRLDVGVVSAIRALEDDGVRVGLSSGRPFPVVLMLQEYLGLTGPVIAENGGIAQWGDSRFELGNRADAKAAYERLREHCEMQLAWDNACRVTDYAIDRDEAVEGVSALAQELQLSVDIHVSSIMIHLSKQGVDKGAGLLRCLDAAHLSAEDVIVAGDSDNDLPMMACAAKSFAPASCAPAVARSVSFVAPSRFSAGFCEGLDHFRRLGALPPRGAGSA